MFGEEPLEDTNESSSAHSISLNTTRGTGPFLLDTGHPGGEGDQFLGDVSRAKERAVSLHPTPFPSPWVASHSWAPGYKQALLPVWLAAVLTEGKGKPKPPTPILSLPFITVLIFHHPSSVCVCLSVCLCVGVYMHIICACLCVSVSVNVCACAENLSHC